MKFVLSTFTFLKDRPLVVHFLPDGRLDCWQRDVQQPNVNFGHGTHLRDLVQHEGFALVVQTHDCYDCALPVAVSGPCAESPPPNSHEKGFP